MKDERAKMKGNHGGWHWYEWGNERIGYVSTWRTDEHGRVIHGEEIRREEALRRMYQFECPFA